MRCRRTSAPHGGPAYPPAGEHRDHPHTVVPAAFARRTTTHVRDGYDGPANPTRRWTTEIILVSRHPHPTRRPREPACRRAP